MLGAAHVLPGRGPARAQPICPMRSASRRHRGAFLIFASRPTARRCAILVPVAGDALAPAPCLPARDVRVERDMAPCRAGSRAVGLLPCVAFAACLSRSRGIRATALCSAMCAGAASIVTAGKPRADPVAAVAGLSAMRCSRGDRGGAMTFLACTFAVALPARRHGPAVLADPHGPPPANGGTRLCRGDPSSRRSSSFAPRLLRGPGT